MNRNGNPEKQNKVICMILAITLILALFMPGSFNVLADSDETATSTDAVEVQDATMLSETSLELNLGDNEDITVTLEGMMPEGATASLDDVVGDFTYEDIEAASAHDAARDFASEDTASRTDAQPNTMISNEPQAEEALIEEETPAEEALIEEETPAEETQIGEEKKPEVVAAYDITIFDNNNEEYQPDEDCPIHVEITDPAITGSENLELWHIRDNGESEKIEEFEAEEGKISFYAEGFSVYAVTDIPEGQETSLFDLLDEKGPNGIYVRFYYGQYSNNTDGPFYFVGEEKKFTDGNQNGRIGLTVTGKGGYSVPSDAVKLYFEKGDQSSGYYLYIKDGENKKYLKGLKGSYGNANRSAVCLTENSAEKSQFILEESNGRAKISCDGFYWVAKNKDQDKSLVGFKNSDDASLAWMEPVGMSGDYVDLDGKTYGLMNYVGGTYGYALMAGEEVHSLIELVTRKIAENSEGKTLFVDEGSEVTRWTFHAADNGGYKLSGETADGTEGYLAVNGDDLEFVQDAAEASVFTVSRATDEKIRILYNGKAITYTRIGEGDSATDAFKLSDSTGDDSKFNLIDFAKLSDEDYIIYSADCISISTAENGKRYILYTRIWDGEKKKYDTYAVDYDGTLYPVYASGGKILWLGDGTSSLEWIFTEYVDEVSKLPNHYYELYNPYSEKYIAPLLSQDQILADNKIGINMPGRKDGEFYSNIIVWDKKRYAYIGMKPDEEKKKLIPCSESTSATFYFAELEELNLGDSLHEVETIDNIDHGISVKMQDFSTRKSMSDFLGNDTFNSQSPQKGLLSKSLGEDGYPVAKGGSLKKLFANPETVNHLFIKNTYKSSGYYEFDSCQNFATLCDEDGNLKPSYQHVNADGTTTTTRDFTVYRELGTTDGEDKSTLKHGQFLPYNIIKPGRYTNKNKLNKYSALANTSNSNAGKLDDEDPRKDEKLYMIADDKDKDAPNYYNGMEVEASFVQTVSGFDAWGHDIIFEFTGDDDFWLYVDGELVIDLGGVHSALSGKVNFRTGEVAVNKEKTTLYKIFKDNFKAKGMSDAEVAAKLDEIFELNSDGQYTFKDYTTHSMKIFYMERGGGASNLHMKFNLASVTPGHVVISKSVTGAGAAMVDKDFVEYPFQIYYKLKEGEDGQESDWILLGNDDEHIRVSYQNSNQPVPYVDYYRPPGFSGQYDNVYFINPLKSAEIAFPDNTISYRIIECAVDSRIYGNVLVNGEDVEGQVDSEGHSRVTVEGNLKSYASEIGSSEKKPSLDFDNVVEDNVVKDLLIKKRLFDKDGVEITDSTEKFSYRLSLSSRDVPADEIPRANMHDYYILSPDKKLCRHDETTDTFVETDIPYTQENIKKIRNNEIDGIETDDVIFVTSPFGAIADIPVGYTICVPGLLPNSLFKVTEDPKDGYGLMGYEMVCGEKGTSEHEEDLPSYLFYVDEKHQNIGRVIVDYDSIMEVHNQQGYSMTAEKNWSDLDITTGHDTIYVAAYADNELVEDSVKSIVSPATTAFYFWPSLKPNADGSERTDLNGYEIREVKLEGGTPVLDEEGTVTNYRDLTVTPLAEGDEISLNATRTVDATPDGENADKVFDYVVTYKKTVDENGRRDVIKNTRSGGVTLRLFKWNSEEPLTGGAFTLTDSAGNVIGKYTSEEGLITMMYDFKYGEKYTVTQNSAPDGYVGIQKKFVFVVNSDETVSLFYENGDKRWGEDDSNDIKWADSKPGENGIISFVDIFNKQFNFKLVKTDSKDTESKLGAAHFALYKQANTPIGGYEKNKKPMSGFEDLVTVDGEVVVCGEDTGRVLSAGDKGTVYYLTETKAPFNYVRMEEDIVLKISPIGKPSIISGPEGKLEETDDNFIYTLSVPNVKEENGKVLLEVTKTIAGNMGNKNEKFDFTFFTSDDDTLSYEWTLNDINQENLLKSGDTFTLGHGDKVVVNIPKDTEVTITEKDSREYKTSVKVDDGEPEEVMSKTVTMDADKTIEFINTKKGVIPTGVWMSYTALILLGLMALIGVIFFSKKRTRRQ